MIDLPFITVVMPVRNEEGFISTTLTQLLQQNYPRDRFELLVVDGMSEDRTKRIVREFQKKHRQVILLENRKQISSAGRNIGFKAGRGDIYIVIDGHCYIPTDSLFKSILDCLEKAGVECLGRPQHLDPPGISKFQAAVAIARSSSIGHAKNSMIYSNYEGYISPLSHGAVYKKEVFEKIGYVDETFDACEDVEFNYRVEKGGIRAYMSPTLTIKYYPRSTLRGLFGQMRRYGRGRWNLLRKHPETLSLNMVLLALFVSAVLSFPFLGLLHRWFWYLFAFVCGSYSLAILSCSTHLSLKRGFHHFVRLLAIFPVLHFGLGCGFLIGFIHAVGSIWQPDKAWKEEGLRRC